MAKSSHALMRRPRIIRRLLPLLLVTLVMLTTLAPAPVLAAVTIPANAIQINRQTAMNVFVQDTFRYPDTFVYAMETDGKAIADSLYEESIQNLMVMMAVEHLSFEQTGYSTGESVLTIKPTYLDSTAERAAVRAYVNRTAEALFTEGMTDRERLVAVNRHLVENFSYDQTFTIYSVHPFITTGSGVCQSYAQLGVMLLLAGGVAAHPVSGVVDGVNHAWIAVRLEDAWYEFDPTYNDSVGYQDANTRVAYLARTHEEMRLEGRSYDACLPYTYTWEDGLRQTALATSPPGSTTPGAATPEQEDGDAAMPPANPFPDIQPGQWYYEAALRMNQDGLMIGVNGQFEPNGTVTLSQVLTVAARMHARDSENTDVLTDLTNAAAATKQPWYQGYLDYALAMDIIKGNEFGTAWINRHASREEMAYILQRTAGELQALSSIAIPDLGRVAAPFVLPVRTMANAGIITGVDANNTFQPDGIATRAQLAVILDRLMRAATPGV
jgi:transglutaminase-like putative cysteine protease